MGSIIAGAAGTGLGITIKGIAQACHDISERMEPEPWEIDNGIPLFVGVRVALGKVGRRAWRRRSGGSRGTRKRGGNGANVRAGDTLWLNISPSKASVQLMTALSCAAASWRAACFSRCRTIRHTLTPNGHQSGNNCSLPGP